MDEARFERHLNYDLYLIDKNQNRHLIPNLVEI